MRRNGHVSYAKKAFGDDCCYFETIEAFPALPMGYSHECRLNIALRSCAPNLHLYFTGYEQKVPACGTNFTVQVATVEKADRILVMEAGRVIESGTHAELLTRNGQYAVLHRLQFND